MVEQKKKESKWKILVRKRKCKTYQLQIKLKNGKKLLPEPEYDTESIRDEMKQRQYLFLEDRDAMETLEKEKLRKLLSERENDTDYMINQFLGRYPRLEIEDLLKNYVYFKEAYKWEEKKTERLSNV
jgi:hypothetical protein